jgi:LDH2 family malate/lactate/ureidoglycolate dehydrogenase
MNSISVKPENLRRFYRQVLDRFELAAAHRDAIIDHLIDAGLMGVDSHALQQIIGYTRSLTSGRIKRDAGPVIIKQEGNIMLIDGDGGAGQYVGKIAMQAAIAQAKKTGLALAGVYNSNHYGMAGYYTRMACAQGLIGFASSDTNVVDLAPYGGLRASVGNNPYSWGIPTGTDTPVVLDAACGSVSGGKIKDYGYRNVPLPAAWGLNRDGQASAVAADIIVNTADSFKSSGLALVLDLICGPLLGTLAACHKDKKIHNADNGTGHLFLAINPGVFTDVEKFYAEVEATLVNFKNTAAAAEDAPIYYPGEIEILNRRHREHNGIPIPSRLLEALKAEYGDLAGLLHDAPSPHAAI